MVVVAHASQSSGGQADFGQHDRAVHGVRANSQRIYYPELADQLDVHNAGSTAQLRQPMRIATATLLIWQVMRNHKRCARRACS